VAIEWTGSSARHGVDQDDALHAMLNPLYHVSGFETSRVEGLNDPDLFIGPGRDGKLLEVMVAVEPTTRTLWVFHAMPVRPKTLAKAKEENR